MALSVEELCHALVSAFTEGRVDGLSDHYVYPLVIYLPKGFRVEMTPKETAEMVFARRAAAVRAGMQSVRLRIAEVAEMDGGRIPVRLSWEFLDGGGGTIARSALRYFCRRSADGSLRVEMIEFTEIAFPDATPRPTAPTRRN
jgi:hypothetical protein